MNADNLQARAEAHRARWTTAAAAIAQNGDLTADAKERQLDALWQEGRAALAVLRDEHQRARDAATAGARRKVYGLPTADPARHAAFRHALDRATTAAREGRLRDLLDQADRAGDEDQALACFSVAEDHGDTVTEERYLASRPEKHAAAAELRATLESGGIMEGFAFSEPTRPRVNHELMGHRPRAAL